MYLLAIVLTCSRWSLLLSILYSFYYFLKEKKLGK